jgi:hypothetical protein
MDVYDKHRELVLAVFRMSMNLRAETLSYGFGEQQRPWETRPRNVRILGRSKMEVKVKMAAQVGLKEFSGRDDESLIPVLTNLLRFTSDSIESFAEEFR